MATVKRALELVFSARKIRELLVRRLAEEAKKRSLERL
jgi:hypothetical protein